MRILLFLVAVALGSSPAAGRSEAKRFYLIDTKKPAEPVEIKERVSAGESRVVLLDPVMPGQHRETMKVDAKPAPRRARAPEIVPAQLSFKKMLVQGKHRDPRVDFFVRRMNVGRADEPIDADFYKNILKRGFDDGL